MEKTNNFELVICITDAGYSQNVMESAKDAGARGGTILKARGSANPEAEEFFNITIQPEKEVLLILVPKDIRDDVIRSIYTNNDMSKEGKGIVFSLPVERTTSIKISDNQ